jgi:hypothetical protein
LVALKIKALQSLNKSYETLRTFVRNTRITSNAAGVTTAPKPPAGASPLRGPPPGSQRAGRTSTHAYVSHATASEPPQGAAALCPPEGWVVASIFRAFFPHPLILHLERRTFFRTTLPPIIEPGRGDVRMAEPLLHLGDIDVR